MYNLVFKFGSEHPSHWMGPLTAAATESYIQNWECMVIDLYAPDDIRKTKFDSINLAVEYLVKSSEKPSYRMILVSPDHAGAESIEQLTNIFDGVGYPPLFESYWSDSSSLFREPPIISVMCPPLCMHPGEEIMMEASDPAKHQVSAHWRMRLEFLLYRTRGLDDAAVPRYVGICILQPECRDTTTIERCGPHDSWERNLLRYSTTGKALPEQPARDLLPGTKGSITNVMESLLSSTTSYDTLMREPYSPVFVLFLWSSMSARHIIHRIPDDEQHHQSRRSKIKSHIESFRWLRMILSHNSLLLKQKLGGSKPSRGPPPSPLVPRLLESIRDMESQMTRLEHALLSSQHLSEKAEEQRKAEVLNTQQLRLAELGIQETRMALEEARSVTLLTRLAFFYIPLTFVTGLFGMNLRELSGEGVELSVWVFVVAAVIIGGATYLVLAVMYRNQVRRMRGEVMVERSTS